MKRKLIALLMAGVMSAALLAGCSGGTQEKVEEAAEAVKEDVEDKAEEVKGAVEDKAEEVKEEVKEDVAEATGEKYKVYLVTMDQQDQHWVKVDAGAKKAAEELGDIDYTWLAPDVKDDNKQIESVNNAVAGGAQVLLIAANGPDSITGALKEAEEEGVKIIYIDSPANHPALQTLATDNQAAGKTAGEEMIKVLAEKGVTSGKIGIIGVNPSTTSTVLREEGFRSAFEGTDFELMETQYGQGDPAQSKDIAANYLNQGCVALFGTNEGSTVGAGNAVAESGDDKLVAVGFDTSDTILNLIKDGHVVATMAQNPDVMGYEGVKAAEKAMKGETLSPEYVDTGVSVITKDTL